MGRPVAYQPHKLFVAALLAPSFGSERVHRMVEQAFGPVDLVLPSHEFAHSTYYEPEMGPHLQRALFAVAPLVDPGDLARFKERSNALEREPAATRPGADGPSSGEPGRGRVINLDPGLLSLSRVILATTKASAHRVPLRDGFFAEITLLYRSGRYRPFEWTYPDFRSDEFVEWLGRLRSRYHDQLREIDPDRAWRL